jgi:hypothetical protein
MLVTQHVSGIIMPIIRSTVKDDKPHMVFRTTSAKNRMRFVILYCTPDDGHNDA